MSGHGNLGNVIQDRCLKLGNKSQLPKQLECVEALKEIHYIMKFSGLDEKQNRSRPPLGDPYHATEHLNPPYTVSELKIDPKGFYTLKGYSPTYLCHDKDLYEKFKDRHCSAAAEDTRLAVHERNRHVPMRIFMGCCADCGTHP